MAVPEGATKLGTVGIAYKGVYDELATYKYANAVYYNGSTYIALIDNPAGFPSNDGVNWRYLAQGFLQQAISALTVIDESGILGEVDAEVNAQEFLSKIAELQQGLEDTKANKADILDSLEEVIANTEEGRIAGANAVGELNSNLDNCQKKCDISSEGIIATLTSTSTYPYVCTEDCWMNVSRFACVDGKPGVVMRVNGIAIATASSSSVYDNFFVPLSKGYSVYFDNISTLHADTRIRIMKTK